MNDFRPPTLSEIIGQDDIKKELCVYIKAARETGKCIAHSLFFGPAGTGKTTFAKAIANDTGTAIHTLNAATVKNKNDLITALISLEKNEIFFIDEIHRLKPEYQETLYTAMEDLEISIIVNDKITHIDLESFTLVGGTTHPALLTKPLRERFINKFLMKPYTQEQMEEIVSSNIDRLSLTATMNVITEIAKRSARTPRRATGFLSNLRDFCITEGTNEITKELSDRYFEIKKIDKNGLEYSHLKYLKLLGNKLECKPAGIDTIANLMNEGKSEIEENIEPPLIDLNLIAKTSRGRKITDTGIRYLLDHKETCDN